MVNYETIHVAAKNGDLDDVKRHVQKGADINEMSNDGWMPLMLAMGKGHLEVVKFLVTKGADVNARHKDGWTPLMLAASYGHLEVVKFLVTKGTDVNARHKDGKTPLMVAADKDHLDVVEFLKQQGAKELSKQQQRLFERMENATNCIKLCMAEKLVAGLSPDSEKRKIVAAAINTVFSEPSSDPQHRRFADEHADGIAAEIDKLKGDRDACVVITQAVRVLVKIDYDETQVKQALVPLQKLEELGLLIPGGDELVPDMFFDLVRSYCKKNMSSAQFDQMSRYF